MNYWLINYFRDKKYILATLYFFICIILLCTIYYTAEDVKQSDDSYYFYNDRIISSLNFVYLIFLAIIFFIFLHKILFELKIIKFEISKLNNLILLATGGFLVALIIWYEFYYIASFYNGDIKLLSIYFIASSISFSIWLTILFSNKFKSVTLLFFIFVGLAYFIYEFQLVGISIYIDMMNITY